MADTNRQLLTVPEAAAWLRCSKTNVYALIGRGTLPVVCVGNVKGYRIDREDLQAFINKRRKARPKTRYAPSVARRLKHIRM